MQGRAGCSSVGWGAVQCPTRYLSARWLSLLQPGESVPPSHLVAKAAVAKVKAAQRPVAGQHARKASGGGGPNGVAGNGQLAQRGVAFKGVAQLQCIFVIETATA